MCGRFTVTMTALEIETLLMNDFSLEAVHVDDRPRYNMAPTQSVMGILFHQGKYRFGDLKWGLQFSNHLAINTRIETIEEKSYFKDLMKSQRIVLLSNGYFEWDPTTKTPYYIHYENQAPMYFGGLWRKNNHNFECSIITLPASDGLSPIHPRMPFSMRLENAQHWLKNEEDPKELINIPDQVIEISSRVNKVSENDKDILRKNTA